MVVSARRDPGSADNAYHRRRRQRHPTQADAARRPRELEAGVGCLQELTVERLPNQQTPQDTAKKSADANPAARRGRVPAVTPRISSDGPVNCGDGRAPSCGINCSRVTTRPPWCRSSLDWLGGTPVTSSDASMRACANGVGP